MNRNLPAILGGLLALAVVIGVIYVGHQIGKYPEEPAWSPPGAMFANFAFVLALGLGIPWPEGGAVIFLALAGGGGYWLGRWAGRRLAG